MKLFEKRVSNARCYTTTTYYLFGRRIRQVKVYKGGKAHKAPKLDINMSELSPEQIRQVMLGNHPDRVE